MKTSLIITTTTTIIIIIIILYIHMLISPQSHNLSTMSVTLASCTTATKPCLASGWLHNDIIRMSGVLWCVRLLVLLSSSVVDRKTTPLSSCSDFIIAFPSIDLATPQSSHPTHKHFHLHFQATQNNSFRLHQQTFTTDKATPKLKGDVSCK